MSVVKSALPLDFAVASAPASIGNVGVGFDVLGQAFDAARDEVTAFREAEPGVRLGEVGGLVDRLPDSAETNTALSAAQALLRAAGATFGVRLAIHKGVPISGGMGGSAASAVAGAAATNALLPNPYALPDLLPFALQGERISSDPPPWDNVAASLFGGLVLVASEAPPLVHRLPVPAGIVALLFHPALKIETRSARQLLRAEVPLRVAVEHSRRLAAFAAGCATGDLDLIRAGFEDVLVEPQRAHLLPCLPAVQKAARAAGALGCSFSGAGPSVFAWALAADEAAVAAAMADAFRRCGVEAQAHRAPANSEGVRIEPARRRMVALG